MRRPSRSDVVAVFGKAGNTTFGGGDPTVASLRRELCDQKGWLSQEQFAIAFAIARVVPGTNVLAFVAASAYQIRGWITAVLAVIAASAPSAVIAVWLLIALDAAQRNRLATAAAAGILASVVGMMIASAWQLIRPALTAAKWPRVLVFMGGALLLREWANWSPLQVLLAAAAIGALWRDEDAL
ncbi:MAG: chromate transporter [Acidobacteria bacterium]|nr:chromate transporter [Acidobacteriota bacterium]